MKCLVCDDGTYKQDCYGDWMCDKCLEDLTEHAYEKIEAMQAVIAKLEDALTPSSYTKYAYIGEFKMTEDCGGETCFRHVPWSSIKDIMKAIRAYAANCTTDQPCGVCKRCKGGEVRNEVS